MNQYIIYDLVILAILVAFALWGMHRGLIRTLFSLVAVLVAFVGSILVSNLLTPTVSGLLEPPITAAIEARLDEAIQNSTYTFPTGEVVDNPDAVPLSGVLDILDDMGLRGPLIDSIRTAVESGMENAAASAAAQVGAAVARALVYMIVNLLSFIIILILWRLLGRTLDLAANLPGLRGLNQLGGLVLGLFRGAVLLFVLAFLVRWLGGGLIPPDAEEQTYLFRFFLTSNPLELLAKL